MFRPTMKKFAEEYKHDTDYFHEVCDAMLLGENKLELPYGVRERMIKLLDDPQNYRHSNCMTASF